MPGRVVRTSRVSCQPPPCTPRPPRGPANAPKLTRTRARVQLSVPVDVMVVVDPGAECDIDIATVNVPVFVSVAVSLLVNGKPLGSGQSDLDYAVCRGEPRPRWRMCAGSRIKTDGTVREVRRGCQAGLQCVRRDDTFATCMPPESRLVYMRTQNWDGTILKCR